MKKTRQRKILEIIDMYEITTQDSLKKHLEDEGIKVTQATLSRDINEMKLKKAQTASGVYAYTEKLRAKPEYPPIFRDSVISVDRAMNTVVLRCRAGTAQAACAALDQMCRDGIVGTIAGDDTIFALMRNEPEAENFVAELRGIFAE